MSENTKAPSGFTYIDKDHWDRALFRCDKTGEVFVDVDGELHSRTDPWCEPIGPIGVATPPIPNLTRDGGGFVYWKGVQVEHFSHSEPEAMIDASERLARRCEHLESLGVIPTTFTAVWAFDWFADLAPGNPWLRFFKKGNSDIYEDAKNPHRICARMGQNTLRVWINGQHEKDINFSEWEVAYHVAHAEGFKTLDAGQREDLGLVYATGPAVIDRLSAAGLSPKILMTAHLPSNRVGPADEEEVMAGMGDIERPSFLETQTVNHKA